MLSRATTPHAEAARPTASRSAAARPEKEPGPLWSRFALGSGASSTLAPPPPADGATSPRSVWQTFARSTVSHRMAEGARIHRDAAAAEGAQRLDALAVTIGRDIYFGQGQYAPQSPDGDHLLRHELAHVAQAPSDLTIDPSRGLEVASPGHRGEREATRVAEEGGRGSYRAARPIAFRQVAPRPVARRTASQIFGPPAPGMTLSEFKEYTRQQADWFVDPALSAGTARDDLWKLLLLTEEGPHILSGVGDLRMSALRAVPAAAWVPLQAFCRGTHTTQHTVRLFPPFPALADRITLGRTLVGLETAIPAPLLEVTVSQLQLQDVQTMVLLPTLTTYWTDFQPHLEQTFDPSTPGARGPEFQRVIVFLTAVGAGLAALAPLRGPNPDGRWVRNMHRFPLPMLHRLVINLGDLSGAKRLVLVLHTGHDPPGAFQDSASLFSDLVLLSPGNLVLMIEGATSLAAITARIPAITLTWGELVGGVRKISQVVIAGHGSAQSVGMAGTGPPVVANGVVTYPEESLDIGDPVARANTKALLDALLTHMPPATARILYAGCLVGSSHAPPGTAAAAIPGALATNQSLGAFTNARAVAALIPAGRVQAARASVALASVTSLTDAAGRLQPTYPGDPHAFGSATQYAQSGLEPEGVLRAAVEVGATNRVTAENLLRTRLAMPATGGWYDSITRLLVHLALPAVLGSGVDLHRVNELANVADVPFLAFWPQFNIVVGHFTGSLNPQPFAAQVYAGVAATPYYTAPTVHHTERMRIVVDQGWLALTGAARVGPTLAGVLASGLSASGFTAFLDRGVLAPHAAALLPLIGPPSTEQIRLALAWFFGDPANADVRAFLSAQVLHPANAPAAFSPAVSAEILAAGRTERDILDQLGFAAAAMAPPVGGVALPLGNVALAGSATNTLLVTGRPHEAHVIVPTALVRLGPSMLHFSFANRPFGAAVRVMGYTGGWAAVDIAGRLGFIEPGALTPPPV
jgi:hypothetical protein